MSLITSDVHTFGGRQAHAHIPSQPFWVFILRIFQLLFALITLALSAWVISQFNNSLPGGYTYSPSADGMNIFTSLWTFIIIGYILVSAFIVPTIYNMWAHIVLEALAVLWWLVTWALQAQLASAYSLYNDQRYNNAFDGDLFSPGRSVYKGSAANAALGAFTWLMFIASFVWLALGVNRLRLASNTGGVAGGPTVAGGPAHNMEPVQPQKYEQSYTAPAPAAEPYQQAPVAQQYIPTGEQYPQQPYAADPAVTHHQQQTAHQGGMA